MELRGTLLFLVAVIGMLGGAGAARAADGDPLTRLTETLLRIGSSGTLNALAAERFGLANRDYPERYVAVTRPDGTQRVVEVVTTGPAPHIFFSQQTAADHITVHYGASGEFITGLERSAESGEVQELSGNEGRAFLQNQTAYWLVWLRDKEK